MTLLSVLLLVQCSEHHQQIIQGHQYFAAQLEMAQMIYGTLFHEQHYFPQFPHHYQFQSFHQDMHFHLLKQAIIMDQFLDLQLPSNHLCKHREYKANILFIFVTSITKSRFQSKRYDGFIITSSWQS